MPDPTAFLQSRHFWRFYARLDPSLDAECLKLFNTTTINRKPYAQSVITFHCGQNCFLDLTITPQLTTTNLALRNTRTGHTGQMSWWDEARWHPFALRWSELQSLFQFWLKEPTGNVPPGAALLLLAPFVGHGADERSSVPARKEALAKHYQHLNLFSAPEVAQLSDRTIVLPSEDDYQWSLDGELGWIFGGDYPCYSLRNRPHAGGEEGQFPFADWSSIVAQLPPAAAAI